MLLAADPSAVAEAMAGQAQTYTDISSYYLKSIHHIRRSGYGALAKADGETRRLPG